ncbi:MAG: glycosyltransferase [Chloroflexota bacterium]|nr:glycosyltransferase [Chloroflexota bacterium]
MRVAIFTETYLPYVSGVTVSTEALARGLGRAGHEVLLVAPRPRRGADPGSAGAVGPEPIYAWLPSYEPAVLVPPGYRMPIPVAWGAGRRAAIAFEPQIVHTQSPFASGLLANEVSRRLSAPLVFTHHTRFADYRHYLGALAAPATGALDAHLRRFWAGCAAVVAPSSDLAAEISERLGAAGPRVRVIPTGIDLQVISRLESIDSRPDAGWPAESVVVAALGRLAREKNLDLLVDAFATAAAGEPKLRLLLIGGGPLEAPLRRRVERAGIAPRVHFAGKQPHAIALGMLKGADLFAFASQTETQGLVLAEALASGLPIVTLDGPGVADSVRHGIDGLVLHEAAELSRAIGALSADAARRGSMAAAARDGAERFAAERRMGEMEDLYRELLA